MVMSYFQRQKPDCKIESFYTTGTQKKIDCFKVDGFCAHCNAVFEAMGCFYHYCPTAHVRKHDLLQMKNISNALTNEGNGPDEKAVHQRKKI